MSHKHDQMWIDGERALEVSPRFETRVDDPHPRRLNYVAGRTLTAQALQTDQTHKDRRAALLGRAMTPGIIEGLDVKVLFDGGGAGDDHVPGEIIISPGCGICADGEDVMIHRPLTVRLDEFLRAAEPDREDTVLPTGLIVLSLKPVRAVTALAADPEDPCPVDPDAYVYDDLVTMDGAQVVWRSFDDEGTVELPTEVAARLRTLRPVRSIRRLPMPEIPNFGPLSTRPSTGNLSLRNVLMPARPLLGRRSALTLALTKLRNDAAFRAFEEEETRAAAGEAPPWGGDVLPLALLQVAGNGEIIFLDRFAVARMGGAARQAAPSEGMSLPLRLRRARFDQFVDHIQDLRTEGAPLAPATQHFLTLPPVGVIPATLVDFDTMRSEFFPTNFKVEAAPVPIQQFEAILSARSGLAPYILGSRDRREPIHPDYVQILVPVPEHLYEPRLLLEEIIDPLFDERIAEAEIDIAKYAGWLEFLEWQAPSLDGVIDIARLPDKVSGAAPTPDDDDDKPKATYLIQNFSILSGLDKAVKGLPLGKAELDAVSQKGFIAAVFKASGGSVKDSELTFTGLKPSIEDISAKIDRANDFIDMSFVRLQADIYRARKHLVGEDDITRLATSPVLANLAGEKAGVETNQLIRTLFAKESSDAPKPRSHLVLPTPQTQGGDNTSSNSPKPKDGQVFFPLMAMKFVNPPVAIQSPLSKGPAKFGTNTHLIAKSLASKTIATSSTALSPKVFIGNQVSTLKADLASASLNASAIAWQGLIYGKSAPLRTVTVAERLKPSPAQEAKNAAVATKAEIVSGIQELGIHLEGLLLPITVSRTFLVKQSVLDDIKSKGLNGKTYNSSVMAIFENDKAVPPEGDVRMINEVHLLGDGESQGAAQILAQGSTNPTAQSIVNDVAELVQELYALRVGMDHKGLPGIILADRLDPDPNNADEGAYYAAAVDALESAVSMLRLAEGRVHAYGTFLAEVRSALLAALENAENLQGEIEQTEADLAEAKHDHTVARALLDEEQERIDAIHKRRRDILEKNVEIIGFARPRTIDRFTQSPGMDVYQPLEDPIPACLEGDADPPEELEEMIEDFREAPVGWFKSLTDEVSRIDRARRLRDAWERSRDRALSWLKRYQARLVRWNRLAQQRRVSGKAATGVRLALAASRARWAAVLKRRAERPLSELGSLGWKTLRDRATRELSIEDLSGAGRAGAALAREGLRELEDIGAVTACFLESLRSVPATIRLGWAETLSVHDDPPDLSDITRAPGWSSIPLVSTNLADDAVVDRAPVDRRQLEHLHRWLFSRIDATDPEARAAMSEIVRVCLLLASHAPVSEIVEGATEDGPSLGVGESFEVSVEHGEAAVGMIATFADSALRGSGVVEDIVGTKALVRITHAPSGPIAIRSDVGVRFARPKRRRLLKYRR